MIAGQQEEVELRKSGHLLEGPDEHLSLHLVRFEDIAAYNHELALLIDGEPCHLLNYVEPCTAEAGLSVMAEVVPSHPQLPVGRVEEFDHAEKDNALSARRTGVECPRGHREK